MVGGTFELAFSLSVLVVIAPPLATGAKLECGDLLGCRW